MLISAQIKTIEITRLTIKIMTTMQVGLKLDVLWPKESFRGILKSSQIQFE